MPPEEQYNYKYMANLARVAQINATIAAQGNKGYSVAPSASSGSQTTTPKATPSSSTYYKDLPGYVPGSSLTDSTSTRAAYAAGLTGPTQPIAQSVAEQPTVPQTAPEQAQVNAPNTTDPNLADAVMGKGSALTSAEMANSQTIKSLADQYRQALASKQGTQVPTTQGQAMVGVQAALPQPQAEEPSIIGDIIETDSNFDSILTMYDEFMSPQTQKASLLDEYNQLSQSLGVSGMNAELINSKRIIDGTEDDIRAEVTATGGMATDSQVLALANARNKSLIKNYNYLLESRDSAMTQLNTMMNLSVQDRQMAEAEFDRKLNFAWKVQEFQQKAVDNARAIYSKFSPQELIAMAGGSYGESLIEKTMGYGQGSLQRLAALPPSIDEQIQQQQLKNLKLTGAKLQQDLIPASTGTQIGTPQQLAQAQGNIDSVSSLLNDKNIRTAVGPTGIARFIGAGWDRLTGGRQNFIGSVEQIRSNLNLESLIGAKERGATFGALSDQELQVLSNSATKIGAWAKKDKNGNVVAYNASEKDFKKELEKINNYAKLDYILKGGDPTSVGIQYEGGHYYTKNIDGTITELR
jgi:hypothetical protein